MDGRRLLRLASLCLLGSLLICLDGCNGQKNPFAGKPPSGRTWVRVTTPHFRIYSDREESQVSELALSLEQDLHLISQVAFEASGMDAEPTDVILFSRKSHFHRYFPKSSGGVSYRRLPLLPESHHTIVTFEHMDESTRITLRHELVHDLFARNFGAAPTWLNEGFAEYFSTVELVDGQVHIGGPLPDVALSDRDAPFATQEADRIVTVLPQKMIPAPSTLLEMSAEEFYGRDKDPTGEAGATPETAARYFGAWALVHLFIDADGDYARRFDEFLTGLRSSSTSSAWREAFAGMDLQKLDQDFASYLAGNRLRLLAVPYRRPESSSAPQVHLLDQGAKHVLLAQLALATSPSPSEAEAFEKELEAAIASGPEPPEAYYLRGLFAQLHGKTDEAKRDLERARQLSPKDPRFLRASLQLQLQVSGDQPGEQELAEIRKVAEELEGIATAPAELLLVARVLAATGETEQARTLAQQAEAQNPADPFVLREHALVLEACGDLDQAVAQQRLAIEFLYEHQELKRDFQNELARLEALSSQRRRPTTRR